jgi:CRISPR-associated endonuclease Csn1
VEADKGTNLYFAIYEKHTFDETTGRYSTKRNYATIPLNVVIERQKQGLSPVPSDADGNEPKYVLSPNDLVYLPKTNEAEELEKECIYKIVSFTGNRLYGVPYSVANSIVDKREYTQLNKVEFTDEKVSIKEVCIPVEVDRLGNVKLK